MSAEKCPCCDAQIEVHGKGWVAFECGSVLGGHLQRMPLCHEREFTKLLKNKLASAEARVKELEGLAIGNERREDDGVWVEVFIPIERLGGADCEGEESPTLGDAMPRKEGV